MPRDLSKELSGGAPQLTRSPGTLDDTDEPPPGPSLNPPPQGKFFGAMVRQARKLDELHPYTQTLTIADLQSCLRIEETAFPPQERATKEKVSQPLFCIHLSRALKKIERIFHACCH